MRYTNFPFWCQCAVPKYRRVRPFGSRWDWQNKTFKDQRWIAVGVREVGGCNPIWLSSHYALRTNNSLPESFPVTLASKPGLHMYTIEGNRENNLRLMRSWPIYFFTVRLSHTKKPMKLFHNLDLMVQTILHETLPYYKIHPSQTPNINHFWIHITSTSNASEQYQTPQKPEII